MTDPAPNNGNRTHRLEVRQACTVLYDTLPTLEPVDLQARLQPLVGRCSVEWATPSQSELPVTAGVARFGHHHIALIALNAPVKQDVLARTVGVSPMPDELRRELMAHRAAIRLLYMGADSEPASQLAALYQVASALLSYGGLGILNERAALAQPAELAEGYLARLGTQPLPLPLWVGVVTFVHDDKGSAQRYLMRTYGLEQFGLPELAMYFGDQSDADTTYYTLLNIGLYLIEEGSLLNIGSGHTAEFKGRTYLFTEPPNGRPELSGPTSVLLLMEV